MKDAERPYRTFGYPMVPLIFVIVAGWLVVNSLFTRPVEAFVGLGLTVLGLPLYFYFRGQQEGRE
jgi:APA family basic amino acid/polyamine antiporter